MKKQVLIMIGIIVVMSMVAIITLYTSQHNRAQRRFKEPVLGQVNIKDIKSIVINNKITLKLNNKIWSYMKQSGDTSIAQPTRQDYVLDMLSALSNFSQGRLIESEPEDLAKYNLSDEDGARVIILKNAKDEELIRIRIGVVVGAFSANYAQINDNKMVYQVDEKLTEFLNQGEQYWLDLRLFPVGLDADKVKKIEITRKEKDDILLERNDKNIWTSAILPDKKINEVAITTYINDVSNSKAYNFSDPQLVDDMLNGTVKFTFNNNNTAEIKLYYFANKYFISLTGGQEGILFLQNNIVDRLFPTIDLFIDTSPDTNSSTEDGADSNKDNN